MCVFRVRALAETELRPQPVLLRLHGSDETGDQKWRWSVVPLKKGDPGSETWPNEEAMRHGGGMTWQMPTYDPALNLIYITTGNPQPVISVRQP